MLSQEYLEAIVFLSLDGITPHHEALWLSKLSPQKVQATTREVLGSLAADVSPPLRLIAEGVICTWLRAVHDVDPDLPSKLDRWIRYVYLRGLLQWDCNTWGDLFDDMIRGREHPPAILPALNRQLYEFAKEYLMEDRELDSRLLRAPVVLSPWEQRVLQRAEVEALAIDNGIYFTIGANQFSLLWRRFLSDISPGDLAVIHTWVKRSAAFRNVDPVRIAYPCTWDVILSELMPDDPGPHR